MSDAADAVGRMLQWYEDEAHWSKHRLREFNRATGELQSTCLLGSARHAFEPEFNGWTSRWTTSMRIANRHVHNAVRAVIEEQFPERCAEIGSSLTSIAKFNDHPDTNITDVRGVLEKARARLQEEAG